MTENNEKLKEIMARLEQERDELKLKFGLAKLEAREEWKDLEAKMETVRGRMKVLGEGAREAGGDVAAAASVLAGEIKEGFAKLRNLM
jgi:hypothetical protein